MLFEVLLFVLGVFSCLTKNNKYCLNSKYTFFSMFIALWYNNMIKKSIIPFIFDINSNNIIYRKNGIIVFLYDLLFFTRRLTSTIRRPRITCRHKLNNSWQHTQSSQKENKRISFLTSAKIAPTVVTRPTTSHEPPGALPSVRHAPSVKNPPLFWTCLYEDGSKPGAPG